MVLAAPPVTFADWLAFSIGGGVGCGLLAIGAVRVMDPAKTHIPRAAAVGVAGGLVGILFSPTQPAGFVAGGFLAVGAIVLSSVADRFQAALQHGLRDAPLVWLGFLGLIVVLGIAVSAEASSLSSARPIGWCAASCAACGAMTTAHRDKRILGWSRGGWLLCGLTLAAAGLVEAAIMSRRVSG